MLIPHFSFALTPLMIQADSCALLSHVRRIDWWKVLTVYFIDEEKESLLQFGKVFLSSMFI